MSSRSVTDTVWRCIAFGPHPRTLVSASSSTVELLDFRQGNAMRTTTVQLAEDMRDEHDQVTRLTALAYHWAKDFEVITACTNFISVMVWSVRTSRVVLCSG